MDSYVFICVINEYRCGWNYLKYQLIKIIAFNWIVFLYTWKYWIITIMIIIIMVIFNEIKYKHFDDEEMSISGKLIVWMLFLFDINFSTRYTRFDFIFPYFDNIINSIVDRKILIDLLIFNDGHCIVCTLLTVLLY